MKIVLRKAMPGGGHAMELWNANKCRMPTCNCSEELQYH